LFLIYYFADNKGNAPVLDYIESLAAKQGKDSRIKHGKISDYIKALSEKGTTADYRN
jgi:phage-related protein